MGGEYGEDDKEEDSEGRTKKGIHLGEGTKWEGSMGKTTRNKVRKIEQKVKGTNWEGSMEKTTRNKARKEGQKRRSTYKRGGEHGEDEGGGCIDSIRKPNTLNILHRALLPLPLSKSNQPSPSPLSIWCSLFLGIQHLRGFSKYFFSGIFLG
jgi:hypothetical protein